MMEDPLNKKAGRPCAPPGKLQMVYVIDDLGMPLIGTVHYGQGYENAFWNGEQMVFGDGDGELFQRFTRSLDVVAHELATG